MTPDQVLKELEACGLRGRGGAGFSMGKKASFLPHGDIEKYLCCNADESEPGTFKDRELMHRNPHQLIEGVLIGAYAAGSTHAFIYIRGEYEERGRHPRRRRHRGLRARYVGESILGSGFACSLVVHRGAGAYICGEETALLDSLEGKRGNPRLKPPFPANQGLYQGPTLINNVETLSNVPHIVVNGADWFRKLRHRALAGDEGRVGLRERAAPGQLRGRAGHPGARHHLRPRGRPSPRTPREGAGSRAARRRRS